MKRPTLACVLGAAGLLLSINVAHARAQSQIPAAPLAFEVASVKPSTSGTGVRGGCHGIDSKYGANEIAIPLGRCVITGGRLSHLILIAYNLHMIRLLEGAPDWVIGGNERFDIQAKAQDATKATEGQLLQMLQTLLADRFKLKFHRQNREVSGFALVVAKNGPKLRKAEDDEVMNFRSSPGPGPMTAFVAYRFSMPMLVNVLWNEGPGPVVDQTQLNGVYDLKLSWGNAGPSLVTALQEQLGLRLQAQKVSLSFFVIESAERPGEN